MTVLDWTGDFQAWRGDVLTDVQGMLETTVGSIRPPIRVVDVPVVLGAPGSPLTVGAHVLFRLGLNGETTILTWSLAGTIAGAGATSSMTLDILIGDTVATLASICAAALPALAAAAEASDQLPDPTWTVVIPDPSWVQVIVTATDGVVEVAALSLRLSVTPR